MKHDMANLAERVSPSAPLEHRKVEIVALCAAAVALILVMHYTAALHQLGVHDALRRLFYLPVILAAMAAGSRRDRDRGIRRDRLPPAPSAARASGFAGDGFRRRTRPSAPDRRARRRLCRREPTGAGAGGGAGQARRPGRDRPCADGADGVGRWLRSRGRRSP